MLKIISDRKRYQLPEAIPFPETNLNLQNVIDAISGWGKTKTILQSNFNGTCTFLIQFNNSKDIRPLNDRQPGQKPIWVNIETGGIADTPFSLRKMIVMRITL